MAGKSAGSFCPSPSRVATQAPRARRTPVCTAALWPLRRECRSSRDLRNLVARSTHRGEPCRRCCRHPQTGSRSTSAGAAPRRSHAPAAGRCPPRCRRESRLTAEPGLGSCAGYPDAGPARKSRPAAWNGRSFAAAVYPNEQRDEDCGDDPPGHDNAPMFDDDRHDHGSSRRLGVAAVLTGSFMVAEAIGGYLAGSLALLADAGHMLADTAALAMAYAAARLAQRPGRRAPVLRLRPDQGARGHDQLGGPAGAGRLARRRGGGAAARPAGGRRAA